MTKIKVEVTNAVVDGKGHGEQISIEKETAEHLESIGYVKIIGTKTTKKDEEGDA
jgi:hypothetical protein